MSLLSRLGTFATLVATLTAPSQAPTQAPPALTFVAASNDASHGANAVDGDRNTVWLGIAKRKPAWIVTRLKQPTMLMGVMVTTSPMPASTFYHVDVSNDGRTFQPVLQNLRNEQDTPVVTAFPRPLEVTYLRLTFENASRQSFVPLILHELSVVPEPAPGSVVGGTGLTPEPTPPSPGATPAATPRILGAVVGQYDGERAMVVVGDSFGYPVDLVKVDGRELNVLGSTGTQILCEYPYARPARVSITVKAAGHTVSRTVSTVAREIRWVPQSPLPNP